MTLSKQLIWTIVIVIVYAGTLAVNYSSISPPGINNQTQTQLSEKYSIPLTPPGLTFGVIWPLIFVWQGVWMVYLLFLAIVNREELNDTNTLSFGVMFYVAWIFSCIGNLSWVIFFAFEEQTVCAAALFLTAISLYLMAFASHRYVGEAEQAKASKDADAQKRFLSAEVDPDSNRTLRLYKILVNNGLTLYATWVSVASCLGIGIFWIYVANADRFVTSLVCLGTLSVLLIVYLSLDFVVCRKYLIDTYTPYVVLLWALTGVATRPASDDLPSNSAIRTWCFVLLGVAGLALLAKIGSAVMWYANGAWSAVVSSASTQSTITDGKADDYRSMNEL